MSDAKLAEFILERMYLIFSLSMYQFYNHKNITSSVFFLETNAARKMSFFSKAHKLDHKKEYKIRKDLITLFEKKTKPPACDLIDNFISTYFDSEGLSNVAIGSYETQSKFIVTFISFLDKDYDYIHKIKNNIFHNTKYPHSMFDALIRMVKYHLQFFEISDNITECKLHYNHTGIHNEAAQMLLGIAGASSANFQSSGLLHGINELSNLTYERKKGKGRIVFSKEEYFCYDTKLMNPVDIEQSRSVRKLLEICSDTHFLLSDGLRIYGIGSVKEENERYILDVFDQCCWQISHSEKLLLRSEFGKLSVTQRGIDLSLLEENIIRIFGGNNTSKIFSLIDTISKSGHGSILVISEGAREESKRLCVNGFQPEIFEPAPSFVSQLSKIDGAVILDPTLHCHGFGVILDGISVKGQDSSRGSRYNSSLRYYFSIRKKYKKTLIVVISDDGMVNFIPPLAKRISKRHILGLITKLKDYIADSDDTHRFYEIFNEIEFFREYFDKELCIMVNPIIQQQCLKDYNKTGLPCSEECNRLFEPNVYIDESYFY